jgi:hypothetical protein
MNLPNDRATLVVVAKPIIFISNPVVIFHVLTPLVCVLVNVYIFVDWFNRLLVNILIIHHNVLEDEND